MLVRLNRFVSAAGVCSRRAADRLIQAGEIRVNGRPVTLLGHRVKPQDVVTYRKSVLKREPQVYLLLNKPKNCITTVNDPQGRTSVLDVVRYTAHRIYPVGRLDRDTTGLLLLTNDGDLATALAHPSRGIPKTYQALLDKPLTSEALAHIRKGVVLDDGSLTVDHISWMGPSGRKVVVELHVGRNRVVRRLFEHFGCSVVSLDRVGYAHLTKKGMRQASWRHLTPAEVAGLRALL